jgi:hypothetical protein
MSTADRGECHQAAGAVAIQKAYKPSDWRFTMEQIGQGLGKIY